MSVRIHLPQEWIEYLIRQPESGMGYQRVTVVLEDGTELEDRLVFNAEEIELPEPEARKEIKELRLGNPGRAARR